MTASGALLTLAVGSACLASKLHLLNAEPVIKIEPSGERRRVWSDAKKAAILEEAFAPGANTSEVGRRYGVSSGLIYTWRATALARLPPDGRRRRVGRHSRRAGRRLVHRT